MKLARRRFLDLTAAAAVLPVASRTARAQTYPTRQVHIVVGYAPGSAADILSRLIGNSLSERLGQPVVIENRGGAGGTLGAEAVVRALPDGYTLLFCGSPDTFNATLYDKLNFNFIQDITPVAGIARLRAQRGRPHLRDDELARGPGNLCRAFGIGPAFDGLDLDVDGRLILGDDGAAPEVGASVRIGLTKAAEREHRFYARGSRAVSGRRSLSP